MPQAAETTALRTEALRLARRVEGYAAEVLTQQESYQDEGPRIAQHAQSVRMLQTFRAVLKLVECDLNDGAAAVLRSLVEQHFVYTALLKAPGLLALAVSQEEGEQSKALKGLRKVPPDARPDHVTDAVLDAEISQRSASGFNAQQWAEKAGLDAMFQTLYRHLSFNAHGALHATNDYVVVNDEGTVLGIRAHILRERSIGFVLDAIGIVMACVAGMDRQPMTEARRAWREHLGAEWNALYGRYGVVAERLFQVNEGPGCASATQEADT